MDINEIRRELINETLWVHYNKEDISETDFKYLLEEMSRDKALALNIKGLIIMYAEDKYPKNV